MARTTWGPLSTDEQNAIEFAPVGEPGVLAPGTTGGLLKRNADGTIGNSILSESGSVLTAAGRLVIGGGTVTASTPVLDLSQAWNNGAVAFNALKVNVADIASTGASLLFDFQVGGSSRLYLSKGGSLTVSQGFALTSSGTLSWNSDTILSRGAAGVLDLRNLANAQTLNVYATADAGLLNYRRIRTTMTTGGAATIAAEGLGTGVSGNTLSFSTDGTSIATMDLNGFSLNAGHIQMVEVAAPSAPGSNKGRLYIEDNGSGKTRLMIRFNTGAAQQIAIEP